MNPLKAMTEQFSLGRNSALATPPSLALVITDREISSFVYRADTDTTDLISGVAHGDWGGATLEELIVSADGVISSAINQVSGQLITPPTRVVLAVPYSWVNKDGLLTEKSLFLAKLTRRLGVSASGFIVVPEAVAGYLKEELGVTNCLLMQVEENDEYLTLIRQGVVVGSTRVNRSDDIASDVEEGMVRLNDNQPFPPVVYLTGNGDLSETKQKLTNYPWSDSNQDRKPGFMQLPKFEVCPPDFEAKAIVSQVTGKPVKQDDPVFKNTISVDEEIPVEIPQNNIIEPAVIGPVVADQSINVLPPEAFGFSRQSTIDESTLRPEALPPLNQNQIIPVANPVTGPENNQPADSYQTNIVKDSLIKRIASRFIETKTDRFHLKKLVFILVPLAIILFLILSIRANASADLRLFVESNKQKQEFEITFSSTVEQADTEKLIVPLLTTQADITGSGSLEVKGTKIVGDKAKGEVTVYNGTATAKNLAKGTLIKSSTGLKFALDETTLIPAKTTDLSVSPPVDKWGEKKAYVTAGNIGAEYNLAANSTFTLDTIASSSSWLIKNPIAFANGSSREVQAVGQNDRDQLGKQVLADLATQVIPKIEEKIKDQGKLIADSIKLKTKTERFDKAVDEEAEELKLEETATFIAQYYRPDDLYTLINDKLNQLVPKGYQQKPNLNDPVITPINAAKGLYKVEISAEYIPEIDITNLANQLSGKGLLAAETIIRSITGVTGYENDLHPKVISIIKRYPFNVNNINITIVAK